MARRKKRAIQQKKTSVFSRVLNHDFACSDLPRSFFTNGFFSCSACDDWRDMAMHGRGKKGTSQTELRSARRQCQRIKRGQKPIRYEELANLCPDVAVTKIYPPSIQVPCEGIPGNLPEFLDAKTCSSHIDVAGEEMVTIIHDVLQANNTM